MTYQIWAFTLAGAQAGKYTGALRKTYPLGGVSKSTHIMLTGLTLVALMLLVCSVGAVPSMK